MVKTWMSGSNVVDMTIFCAVHGFSPEDILHDEMDAWGRIMLIFWENWFSGVLNPNPSGGFWLGVILTSFREVKGQNINVKVKRIKHGNTLFLVRFPGVLWYAESNSECKIMLKCLEKRAKWLPIKNLHSDSDSAHPKTPGYEFSQNVSENSPPNLKKGFSKNMYALTTIQSFFFF